MIHHLVSDICADTVSNGDRLKLQDFCKAAARCRSLDLTVSPCSDDPLDIGALDPVAGSLVRLEVGNPVYRYHGGELESVRSLSLLSHLTSLSLGGVGFGGEEPWVHLAELTSLKQLFLRVAASGDPSPLSALTGLSSLRLESYTAVGQDEVFSPCTFSSLQPLSALQQLVDLGLTGKACSASFPHGLADLSRLKTLSLNAPMLKSLEGVSTGLRSLTWWSASQLDNLADIEHLQGLQELALYGSAVTSLFPLTALRSLGYLDFEGPISSLAGLEGNLCTSLHTLKLRGCEELSQLSVIEGLTALQALGVFYCGVTGLQPIGQLVGGLTQLHVVHCLAVEEEVLELPHIQPRADVTIHQSGMVKEVVLAGGVRVDVGYPIYQIYTGEEHTNAVQEEEGEEIDLVKLLGFL